MSPPAVATLAWPELGADTAYDVLALRSAVFVLEQRCHYHDPDGRDREPSTRHLLVHDGPDLIAYARVTAEPDGGHRLGRVVTASAHRGRGLGAALVEHAVALVGPPVTLHAQAHLERWYTGLGFVTQGPAFDDAGIPHVPMRRDA